MFPVYKIDVFNKVLLFKCKMFEEPENFEINDI